MAMTKKGESAKATQDVEETKKLETLQDYKDDGWKVGPNVKMSYPPVYTLSKGDETIQFRPKMKNMSKLPKGFKPKFNNAKGGMIKGYKKGGEVKGYMGGGEVHMDDSPNSGMITTKGWGKSRAT